MTWRESSPLAVEGSSAIRKQPDHKWWSESRPISSSGKSKTGTSTDSKLDLLTRIRLFLTPQSRIPNYRRCTSSSCTAGSGGRNFPPIRTRPAGRLVHLDSVETPPVPRYVWYLDVFCMRRCKLSTSTHAHVCVPSDECTYFGFWCYQMCNLTVKYGAGGAARYIIGYTLVVRTLTTCPRPDGALFQQDGSQVANRSFLLGHL